MCAEATVSARALCVKNVAARLHLALHFVTFVGRTTMRNVLKIVGVSSRSIAAMAPTRCGGCLFAPNVSNLPKLRERGFPSITTLWGESRE